MEVVFENIAKVYGNSSKPTYAVKNLSLQISHSALHFLLGPSGCGKTTTLRMLAGLEKPSNGRILFDGVDVTNKPAAERGIGMVFQNYALWPHMSVRENIDYGLKLRKLSPQEMKQRLEQVLTVTHLEQFVDRLPGQLSGGQQQRVALARALAIRPNVLLLDEPLSNLDAKLRLEMRDNITRIHKQTGITTVYVTHDQKESLSMGTHISIMRAGELIQTDTPRHLYQNPKNSFIASFIGEANLIPGIVREKVGQTYTVECALGTLQLTRSVENFQPGAKVTISIRPEAIRIEFEGQKLSGEKANRFQLRLDHFIYLGELEQFHMELADRKHLKVSVFNPPEHSLKSGNQVTCAVSSSDPLLLPADENVQSGT